MSKNYFHMYKVILGLEPVPEDFELIIDFIREVESNPHLYLTCGSACFGFQCLKDYVERNYYCEE